MPSSTVFTTDLLLFAVTAVLVSLHLRQAKAQEDSTCASNLKNAAFVFVKPHANTVAVQALVRRTLQAAGITVLSEHDIDGATIDQQQLIDQHYYAIASKATIVPAKDQPVPAEKFQAAFGEPWDKVKQEDRAVNAKEACQKLSCTSAELDAAWSKAEQVVKLGGGWYCGKIVMKRQTLYVFNAFFMAMRHKFVEDGAAIHCYEVEWSPTQLSWADFRGKVLGPTDPAEAPPGSLRQIILAQYQQLGLTEPPNKGDNGVHASASPWEGLAEKSNWLGRRMEQDAFGQAALQAGLTVDTLRAWSVDPRIAIGSDGTMGSVFDALEDLDVQDCLARMVELNKYQA